MVDIIIIGAGPAGLMASIYCARSKKSVMVFEKNAIGGQISSSPKVENFPGVKSISGLEIADNLYNQADALGVEFEFDEITAIQTNGDIKKVITSEKEYEAKAIIIATGASHRKLCVKDEEKFVGKGVGYCVVCDGEFYSGKDVAVVGGGNTALQSAIYLSNICKSVTIVQLLDFLTGEKQLIDDVNRLPNVKVLLGSSVTKLNGDDELESVDIETKGEKSTLAISGLFVSIGQIPANNTFASIIGVDKQGYAIADESCRTKMDGIFVAGDIRTKTYRQITTAVADGTVSAISACNYVDSLRR